MKTSLFKEHDYYAGHCAKYQLSPSREGPVRDGMWSLYGMFVPADKTARILDLGCGTGLWLATLADHGYTAIEGLEVSPHQFRVAQERGLVVHLVDSTVEFLAGNVGRYAMITLLDVLEHVPKDEQIPLLAAIRQALSENGRCLCRVPNANSIVASRFRYLDWTHETSFTEDSLEFVLHAAGFSNICVVSEHTTPRFAWLPRPGMFKYYWRCCLRWMYRCLLYSEIGQQAWRIPLSYNIVGLGTR